MDFFIVSVYPERCSQRKLGLPAADAPAGPAPRVGRERRRGQRAGGVHPGVKALLLGFCWVGWGGWLLCVQLFILWGVGMLVGLGGRRLEAGCA